MVNSINTDELNRLLWNFCESTSIERGLQFFEGTLRSSFVTAYGLKTGLDWLVQRKFGPASVPIRPADLPVKELV